MKARRVVFRSALALLMSFAFSSNLLAQERASRRFSLKSNAALSDLVAPSKANLVQRSSKKARRQRINVVELSGKIPGIGHVRAEFSMRRNVDWKAILVSDQRQEEVETGVILLQGRAAMSKSRRERDKLKWKAASAHLMPQSDGSYLLEMQFPIVKRKHRMHLELSARVAPDRNGKLRAKLRRIPNSVLKKHGCAAEFDSHDHDHQIMSASTSLPLVRKEVELRAYADSAYINRTSNWANSIATDINNLEVFYQPFDLDFNIIELIGYGPGAEPFNVVTSPQGLLSNFRGSGLIQGADLAHLFTGVNLDGSTVGIAYVGVVCNQSYGYGLSQYLSGTTIRSILTAHEIGHNFNSRHDTISGYIMAPSLNSNANSFSPQSLSAISAHTNSRNCLTEVGSPTPSATPTASPSSTPTANPTATPTSTSTSTATPTRTPTATATTTPTGTATPRPSATPSPSSTVTSSPSASESPSPSSSQTPEPSASASETPSPSPSVAPSESPKPQPSSSQTPIMSPSPTPTDELSPDASATASPNGSAIPQASPGPEESVEMEILVRSRVRGRRMILIGYLRSLVSEQAIGAYPVELYYRKNADEDFAALRLGVTNSRRRRAGTIRFAVRKSGQYVLRTTDSRAALVESEPMSYVKAKSRKKKSRK